MGIEGCIRVIQPKSCYKGNHMDEELKKQSCVEYREGCESDENGILGKDMMSHNLKKVDWRQIQSLNPDKGSWRLFLEGEQLKHLNQSPHQSMF